MNFSQARSAMVESQIHTMGVITPAILEAFRTVPREAFVPPHLAGIAYIDEDIPLGDGRVLIEPAVLARMIEAAQVNANDVVLNVGDSTGYSSAVLSLLATTVVTMESHPGQLDAARHAWAACDYCNIAPITCDATEGCPEHAPYSLIVMNGAVAEIPEIFVAQLSVNGRLVAVLKPDANAPGHAVIVQRVGNEKYSTTKVFDASMPYLPGFEPRHDFVF
ncbi:protein-L-isoaspartate O-methyltransferase family protein [Micavibrio aeruginosavorus]|uniref:Protein-L-isoaspartate O-methyltransferase n=1 Tax=Micavibrio aeruginosavorus EPB TaxID=349215 RepID=M4VIQ3_9BACT|nr:protein-L-isoaspartate O-methyltransferase [Micavibrio aeruginosavorus]AGH97926.1 Protein-L-isoaspartate O-methyltransferase [Micavibrio aeruginosavorus EPB]